MRDNSALREHLAGGAPDAAVLRQLGYTSLAKIVDAGGYDSALMDDLLQLSTKPSDRTSVTAGQKIFNHCCPDKELQRAVSDFCQDDAKVEQALQDIAAIDEDEACTVRVT
jgi:hypothetical protein